MAVPFEGARIMTRSSSASTRAFFLAATLLLRAADHGLFAVWVLTRHPGWTDIFDTGALYGLVDGTLGLVTVALLMRLAVGGAPRLLATMTFIDAVGRLVAGIALRLFPGIPVVLVTAVPFFVALGAVVAGLGVVAMAVWLVARLRAGRGWSLDTDALFDPLAVAALVSFGVGYALFTKPPATSTALRAFAVAVSATLALVFFIASLGAVAHRRSMRAVAPA
jgi:hypothetical protein